MVVGPWTNHLSIINCSPTQSLTPSSPVTVNRYVPGAKSTNRDQRAVKLSAAPGKIKTMGLGQNSRIDVPARYQYSRSTPAQFCGCPQRAAHRHCKWWVVVVLATH